MFMKFIRFSHKLTPCSLVLCAAPIVFLTLPNGIPFVYAGCPSGSVMDTAMVEPQTVTVDECKDNSVTKAEAFWPVSWDNSPDRCRFAVHVIVLIEENYCFCWRTWNCQWQGQPDTCEACALTLTDIDPAATRSFEVESDESGDNMYIAIIQKSGCSGTCDADDSNTTRCPGASSGGVTLNDLIYLGKAVCD